MHHTDEHMPDGQTPSVPPTPPDTDARAVREPHRWPCLPLYIAVALALFVQVPHMVCACYIGGFQAEFAMLFDVAMLVRTIVADLRKERGYGWVIWVLLLLTSKWWIEGIIRLVARH